MPVSDKLHPSIDSGDLEASLHLEGEVHEQKDQVIITDQYICLYTMTIMDGTTAAEILWVCHGIYNTSSQAFGAVLSLTGITGIRIIKTKLPTAFVPLVGGYEL